MPIQGLNNAITGLKAAQQQLSTISNNISNATTPGYNRQILPQSTQVLHKSGTTVGVLTETVIRSVDMNLQRDLWTQISATSIQDVQVGYLQQIQTFNGPPDRNFSVASKLADLRDSFSALSDTPDDTRTQQETLDSANIVAEKINDYAALIGQLRNDAQADIQSTITRVNSLLEEIATINIEVKSLENFNRSVAGLQDQRDIAIKELAQEIDISFFERSDGVLVVQTREGVQLADEYANRLELLGNTAPLSPDVYYPETVGGINVTSTTTAGRNSRIDITEREIGGRLGGLVEIRDETMPKYQAQLDELAFQLAPRLDSQGLRLFTDSAGLLPSDAAPDPSTLPLPTPVDYVGFANEIKVNSNIEDDLTGLQPGTFTPDTTIPTGDNALIKRVLEFGFGSVDFQQAAGTIDITDGGALPDLHTWLGLSSVNQVVTGVDLGSFNEINDGIDGTNTDIMETLQDHFQNFPIGFPPTTVGFPAEDQFQITFEEPRLGLGPVVITVDLEDADTNFPIGGGVNDALDQIISEVNNQIALAGLPAGLTANATRNNSGQLIIESNGNIGIDGSTFPNAMGVDALNALGISEGNFTTEDPSFTVQVGNNNPVTITIEPGDTAADLVNKLEYDTTTQTGVPGLFVDLDPATGQLTLRPGIDDSNFDPAVSEPLYGGGLSIVGGPFDTGAPANATLAALPDSVNVISAIFGSFDTSGGTAENISPINNVSYQLETRVGSGTFINFRNDSLGPGSNIDTDIFSASSLIDYAQKIVDETSADYNSAQTTFDNEDTLRGIIQRQFSDRSAVNIDEEMSHLIIVQTAYAAAARAVTAADEMFQELLNAIR